MGTKDKLYFLIYPVSSWLPSLEYMKCCQFLQRCRLLWLWLLLQNFLLRAPPEIYQKDYFKFFGSAEPSRSHLLHFEDQAICAYPPRHRQFASVSARQLYPWLPYVCLLYHLCVSYSSIRLPLPFLAPTMMFFP